MKFNNKLIEVVFENCDGMEIIADVEINEVTNAISIDILKENNGIYSPFRGNASQDETTKFTRLTQFDDITMIFIDGVQYSPTWHEEDEEYYSYSDENEYQKSYLSDDGDLHISIKKPTQEEIDNEICDKVKNLCDTYGIEFEFKILR